jgi:hypothetical protein
MPPKRKQQSTKKPADQKGKKTWKEAEKEVAKESAMVAPDAGHLMRPGRRLK